MSFDSRYLQQINKCIKTNQLTLVKGGFMEEFENATAKMFGNKFGVSTCNGTASLYLALFCLSLKNQKKEVIVPAYGFHAMVSVICVLGLKPVFCDVDPNTYTIDFVQCKKLINKKTLAIMVLHPWGNPANLDKMSRLKQENQEVFFISDSSHAHEVSWNDKPMGKFFDISCASFGLGKLISGGELGILTTDNPVFRDRALLFSHTNRVPEDLITQEYKNINNVVGLKFRPHLFALLLALHDLKNNKYQRLAVKNNFLRFKQEMTATGRISFQENYPQANRVFYMPLIDLGPKIKSGKLVKDLISQGFHAETHKFSVILPKQSIFTDFYGFKTTKKFINAQIIAGKNMIHIHSEDFIDTRKVTQLKKILLQLI